MAVTPTYSVGSQLDRAITAYLISVGITNVSPGWAVAVQTYPNVTVKSHSMTCDPVNIGLEIWQVQIQMIMSAASIALDPNVEGNTRVLLDALVGSVKANMLQTNNTTDLDATAALINTAANALATTGSAQSQANNADMANFTLLHLYWRGATRSEPEEEGAAWVEVLHFECHAVPQLITS